MYKGIYHKLPRILQHLAENGHFIRRVICTRLLAEKLPNVSSLHRLVPEKQLLKIAADPKIPVKIRFNAVKDLITHLAERHKAGTKVQNDVDWVLLLDILSTNTWGEKTKVAAKKMENNHLLG